MTVAAPAILNPFDPAGRVLFDADAHKYWLDERCGACELISVTTALQEGLAGTMGEQHWTEEARQRGSACHEAILYHAQDDLDESTLHDIVKPYFEGYLKFIAEERPTFYTLAGVQCVELRVFDEAAGYGGTFDMLCVLNGPNRMKHVVQGYLVLDLIDVKTGHIPWWVRLQLAAYKRPILRALSEHGVKVIIREWALNLCKDESFHLKPVISFPGTVKSEGDFLSVLRTAQLKRWQS